MISTDDFCYLPVKSSHTVSFENLVICAEYMKRGHRVAPFTGNTLVAFFKYEEIQWPVSCFLSQFHSFEDSNDISLFFTLKTGFNLH